MTQTIQKCPKCGRFLQPDAKCPIHQLKGEARQIKTTRKSLGPRAGSGPTRKTRDKRDNWQPKATTCAKCPQGKPEKTAYACERFPWRIDRKLAEKTAVCRL